jgi:hypothetical protein
VDTALELQPLEDLIALEAGDDLLEAPTFGFRQRHRLGTPAAPLRVALVHAEQVAGEERRLVATRAGANLHDGVLLVVWVAGQEQGANLLLEAIPAFGEIRELRLGELSHLGVALPEHRLCALELLQKLSIGGRRLGGGPQRSQLLREPSVFGGVRCDLGVRELLLQTCRPRRDGGDLVQQILHGCPGDLERAGERGG